MFKCTSRSSSGIEYSHRIKTHRVGESRRRECSPAEVEEAGRTSGVIELDLPKLRIGALKGTPGVAGAVGYLVDADVQGRHCRKPVLSFCCDALLYHKSHTQIDSEGLCAPARLGALSMATQQCYQSGACVSYACPIKNITKLLFTAGHKVAQWRQRFRLFRLLRTPAFRRAFLNGRRWAQRGWHFEWHG